MMPGVVIQPVNLVPGATGGGEIAEPIVSGGSSAITRDEKPVVVQFGAGLQQFVGPAQRLSQLIDAHVVHREKIEGREVGFCPPERLRHPPGRLQSAADVPVPPTAVSHQGRPERRPE